MARRFGKIYRDHAWGQLSGPGSIPSATSEYRDLLERFIRDHDIERVVDLGCGDCSFMHKVDWGPVTYLGVDVVSNLVDDNRSRNTPRIEFAELDITTASLPPADLAIVKDVLQHWSNDIVIAFLERLKAYRWVIVTNCSYAAPNSNRDIPVGGFRPIDIRAPPFSIDASELMRFGTDDGPPGTDNKLVLLVESPADKGSSAAEATRELAD